jgi:carbamoyl-phosphate synthase large subunit
MKIENLKLKIKKILVLGSGALKIGEAGEFDYSGSQAIKSLKEESIKAILVNPNIATIQTSKLLADTVYFLPVNSFFVEKIIAKEKPDGILLSFGGQTALNCGIEMYKKGVLKKHKVKILGTPISGIILTEDRSKFAKHLRKIGLPIPKSGAAKTEREALKIAQSIGFPVMIRSGFSLGGQGSGVAQNKKDLQGIVSGALSFAPQVLIEKYLHHYKEIEYEVVRDKYDNCVTICNMENMDPMGIHTGESIVVAPSQTLNNFEYQTLRNAAIKIARSLNIIGECNVQFALNPKGTKGTQETEETKGRKTSGASGSFVSSVPSIDYYVIEVNARLSRSSALASKATGYPLAYVAAKLSLGQNLAQIKNKVTKITQSCFEPALDYIVVKIPRWDIEKFKGADEKIGSSMKSVGEVMGIGRTFEEAYQKAIRMLDLDFEGATDKVMLRHGKSLTRELKEPTPKRMFALAEALRRDTSIEKIYKLTGIDPWFLYRIKNIVEEERKLSAPKFNLTKPRLLRLKQLGFSDRKIGELVGTTGLEIRKLRKKLGVKPYVFLIDTLAGEFEAKTNYLYLTYNGDHHDVKPFKKGGVIVLGSGPYRIGSSVEFDWTSVNTALSLKDHDKRSIIINCNPETVSTDYDISDRLYFEELTFERIADIYEFENPEGIIISVGGQTPNNRAKSLRAHGFNILGTDPENIERAENRGKFGKLLDRLNIAQPAWEKVSTLKQAIIFCSRVSYPVLIRPSFVLSGTLMRICHNQDDLTRIIKETAIVSKDYPLTISKFIEDAKEIELDSVAQNGKIIASVISEHIENAGVHSGDATIVLPPQKVYMDTQRKIEEIGKKIALSLQVSGPFNIQFLAKDNNVQVIEVNLRASRTFPFISKVTGIDFVKLAVDSFFNKNPTTPKTPNNMNFVAVKAPQFSFARLTGADPILHVEMASTGEVACFGEDLEEAFLKAELAVGGKIPKKGIFVSIGGEENKIKFLESAISLAKLNLPIFATEKTAKFLRKHNVSTKHLYKIQENKSPNVLTYFQKGKVDLAINLVETQLKKDESDHYTIRRAAIDHNIPLFTNRQKAELFVKAIVEKDINDLPIKSWDEYVIIHY